MSVSPTAAPVTTRIDDGVLVVTLNRPEKKNALTRVMYAAMADALTTADEDPSIAVALIHGAGDAFTAGNDLGDFLSDPSAGPDNPAMRFLRAVSNARKPVVAAVHGAAVGIGATMLLHCDLVFAAPDAVLSMPFVKLGLTPEAASSLLLPRLAGHRRAAEILLLGQPFDAATAREIGLVNRVVPRDELQATAMGAARALAALPPRAVLQTKALLKRDGAETTRRMADEMEIFVEQLKSPEFREIATAFMEKRAPNPAAWKA